MIRFFCKSLHSSVEITTSLNFPKPVVMPYTNLFGRTRMKKVAGAPEEAHKIALAQLEKLRAEGRAPKVDG